jgi:hypothetical protein
MGDNAFLDGLEKKSGVRACPCRPERKRVERKVEGSAGCGSEVDGEQVG